MQGNCTGPAPKVTGVPFLPLKPGQCVLTVRHPPFAASETGQLLLLRNLYFRAASTADLGIDKQMLSMWNDDIHVWLEDLTFQGDFWQGQGGYWNGLYVWGSTNARVHLSGAPLLIG
jgi:hypothetical protein